MIVYHNGKYIEEELITISPLDHGFLYGIGAFETLRTFSGKLHLWEWHVERLKHALDSLAINFDAFETLTGAITELLKQNQLDDAYFRINISAGAEGVGLTTNRYDNPNVIIFVKKLPAVPLEKSLILLKTPRNTPEGTIRIKSHHYLNNVIAKREIGANPTVEGLFLTDDGYIAEGIVSNIFWCKDNCIYTPTIKTGILPGVTRRFVCSYVKSQTEFQLCEDKYKVEKLKQADAVFLTNSIQGIVSVSSFEDVTYRIDVDIVQKLKDAYNKGMIK